MKRTRVESHNYHSFDSSVAQGKQGAYAFLYITLTVFRVVTSPNDTSGSHLRFTY